MSPESGVMERPTIIEESKVLVEKMLERQAIRVQQIQALESQEAQDIRQEMGYDPADIVDTSRVTDTRVKSFTPAVQARELKKVLPLTHESEETTYNSRIIVEKIIKGEDDRVAVVIGPCSIHDPEAALEYADWVKDMRALYGTELEIIMRAYVEKPRTELGWKGLMNDPEHNDTYNLSLGMTVSRMTLLQITSKTVPVAVERIDNRTTQSLDGIVTYDPIGARDVLSTRGRNYLSVTSAVGGAKNPPDGNIDSAVQAVATAAGEHTFLGDDDEGNLVEISSTGNDTVHIILRGSDTGPNYYAEDVADSKQKLAKKKLVQAIGVDASHNNTLQLDGTKDYTKQPEVVKAVSRQIALGETAITLVMIESNLVAGKQDHVKKQKQGIELTYGQSITDACVDLIDSQKMLQNIADAVIQRRLLNAGTASE